MTATATKKKMNVVRATARVRCEAEGHTRVHINLT